MAYSIDFRKKAIEYMEKGHTKEELYEAFGIYPSRISQWRKLLKETGSLEARYPETRERKIDLKKLEQAIEKKPDAYLSELAIKFNCTKQAIFYAQKRLKITYKKTFTYSEKSHLKFILYLWMLIIYVMFLGVEDIAYVDESGVFSTIIAALWGKKHIAVQCYGF